MGGLEGMEEVGRRAIVKAYGVSYWGDETVLKLTVVAHICDYTENHLIVDFK